METKKCIPYAKQAIFEEDIADVASAMRQDCITRGANVLAFEQEVAAYTNCGHAVAFSSGSAALWAAFQAASVSDLDTVLVSPNTFVGSVSGAAQLGARLRFVDVDAYGNMDLGLLAQDLLQERSRGRLVVVPMHFAGVAMDMRTLSERIVRPDTVVIEDAAHAFGSTYPDGPMVGSCAYSDMTVFSFHAAKNITCGEGGMVTTNSEELLARLRMLRDSGIHRKYHGEGSSSHQLLGAEQGAFWYYEVEALSCNGHMTEAQAALGRAQLRHVEAFAKQKQHLAEAYRRKLEAMPGVSLPPQAADGRTHRHLFPIAVEFSTLGLCRTFVMEQLRALGIASQYHYVPLYLHPALKRAIVEPQPSFPGMDAHFKRSLSIPFFSSLTEEEADSVVSSLRKVLYCVR